MANASNTGGGAPGANAPPPEDSFWSQMLTMFPALWASRERNKLIALAAGLVLIVGATAYSQVRLNAWNKPFYNALSQKDVGAFVQQLGVFAVLALILLGLNVAQMWLNQMSIVVLRQGLVEDLLALWLAPLRAFRLTNAGEIAENPDQRIQQDTSHLTELTTSLGVGLLQSTLLLLSFIGVLWALSSGMVFRLLGVTFNIPGYMVWCALLYAGIASYVSWRVGRPLIRLDAERYAREADFRSAVVRVNGEIDGITLEGGEDDERRRVQAAFDIVVGVFNQVQSAMRWFVDNVSNIADWRATLLRVSIFRKTLLTMDELGSNVRRIEFNVSERASIAIDGLRIRAPDLCVKLSEEHVVFNPGERVLICGEDGEERALMFRAISGLWPWGHGRILHPPRETMMFMPSRPYVPPGDLKTAAAYPHPATAYGADAIAKALSAVGLGQLAPMLDKTERWERRLSGDEKQRLAFARAILQRPQWLVMNDALDELDPEARSRIEAMLANELKSVGIVAVARSRAEETLFTRSLKLINDTETPALKAADMLAGASPPGPAREPASAG